MAFSDQGLEGAACQGARGKRSIFQRPRDLVIAGALGLALTAGQSFCAAYAQTPSPPPQQTKSPAPKGETPAIVLNDEDVASVLGQEVFSTSGQSMGRVVDILVDRKGDMRAAIIDFGGFLGVGSRKVAVDWHALHFPEKGKLDRLILSLGGEQVRVAPEYKVGEPVVVVSAAKRTGSRPAVSSDAKAASAPKK